MNHNCPSKGIRLLISKGIFGINVSSYSTQQRYSFQNVTIVDKYGRERRNTLLGPDPNSKFKFNGNVGWEPPPQKHQQQKEANESTDARAFASNPLPTNVRVKTASLIARDLIRPIEFARDYKPPSPASTTTDESETDSPVTMEMKIIKCPRLLKMHLDKIFSSDGLSTRRVVLLNLSLGSLEFETDTETRHSNFVKMASAICGVLDRHGYWSNFLDPASGKPYIHPGSSLDKLIESPVVDEKYREVGFDVQRIAACKEIRWMKWGSDSCIGTIFTDADIGILKKLAKLNSQKAA